MSESLRKRKMVGWYEPGQLARTGIQVALSAIFGRHSDYRIIEALTVGTYDPFDYRSHFVEDNDGECVPDPSRPREEIWLDYVSDIGDGWNSTYTIAYYLAQDSLRLGSTETKRGDVLVLGGDEVYPAADRLEYKERCVQPYETALRSTSAPHPHLFAVPGNHDWYDSLVSFTRLFCSGRWFAGWKTRQKRSYFALRLPHGWWLLGTDVQLGSDIDSAQVDFFRKVAGQMDPNDRVILCNAEPHWIYAKNYGEADPNCNENNLAFLEEKVLKKNVSVFLAGDLHHYRRHEAQDGSQKITAGGGGAFLHPTHGPDVSELDGGFRWKSSYPDSKTSRRICWRNLLFPVLNPTFGLLTASFYLLTAWVAMPGMGTVTEIPEAAEVVFGTMVKNPSASFWVLTLLFGFLFFTDTHCIWYRRIAGFLHGSAHLLATFFLAMGATYVTVHRFFLAPGETSQLIAAGLLIFVGGWVVGPFIMGIYLLASLNVFKRHSNEAFSSLAIEDWKSFLRLRIDSQGNLTIYPIGIKRAGRKWIPRPANSGPELVPAPDSGLSRPELIEQPIVLQRS